MDQRVSDRPLTLHFRLYELTSTNRVEFQAENRELAEFQVSKLTRVASLLETVRSILAVPIYIPSGYRCPGLNKAVGSTDRSQHLLCEAADFVPKGMKVPDAFKFLRKAALDGNIKFGQMIIEKSDRGYQNKAIEWIHISLGMPYRPKERCGQMVSMNNGNYSLLETIGKAV